MNLWQRLFVEHPAAVNEGYLQHLVNAWTFGFRMIGSGFICLIHGLLPGVFCTKAGDTICELHERMITNRRGLARKSGYAKEARRAA
jgi:hypothetical protein